MIRGDEWLSSTPKHVLLYEMLGWTPPTFAHLPLLLNANGKKLSKRDTQETGIDTVEKLLDQGYLPSAVINFVALLGWHPSGEVRVCIEEETSTKYPAFLLT